MPLSPTSNRGGASSGTTVISSQTLSGAAANLDFTGIAATYSLLRLYLLLRTDRASTNDTVMLRLNNDSGANYYWQYINAAGAGGAVTAEGIAATSAQAGFAPGSTATAGRFGVIVLELPFYAATAANKVFTSEYSAAIANTSGNTYRTVFGGTWASASAVTRLTILPGIGTNFLADSRGVLYGIT